MSMRRSGKGQRVYCITGSYDPGDCLTMHYRGSHEALLANSAAREQSGIGWSAESLLVMSLAALRSCWKHGEEIPGEIISRYVFCQYSLQPFKKVL